MSLPEGRRGVKCPGRGRTWCRRMLLAASLLWSGGSTTSRMETWLSHTRPAGTNMYRFGLIMDEHSVCDNWNEPIRYLHHKRSQLLTVWIFSVVASLFCHSSTLSVYPLFLLIKHSYSSHIPTGQKANQSGDFQDGCARFQTWHPNNPAALQD